MRIIFFSPSLKNILSLTLLRLRFGLQFSWSHLISLLIALSGVWSKSSSSPRLPNWQAKGHVCSPPNMQISSLTVIMESKPPNNITDKTWTTRVMQSYDDSPTVKLNIELVSCPWRKSQTWTTRPIVNSKSPKNDHPLHSFVRCRPNCNWPSASLSLALCR